MITLSQRNPEWANIKIGDSKLTVGTDGCLITCNSATTNEIGHYLNPGVLAQLLDFTPGGYLIWASVIKAKLDFVYRFYSRDDAKIKKAFADPDQFIVLQVNNSHWVWLVGVVGGYRVMDPYYGDVIYLTKRRYKITGFAILEKQDPDEWTQDEPNDTDSTGESPDFLGLKKGDKFIDLSHWNEVVDLSKTKSAGYKGVIHKCTQGTGNKDSNYIMNKQRVRDLNLCFGAYHFADAGDPIKEADWFLKNVGEMKKNILVLDYETYARVDAADWCLRFLDRLHHKGISKDRLLLYTYHGLLNKYKFTQVARAGYKLWVARYGLQEQEPNVKYKPSTGGFTKYWAWQYCSIGNVPGINKRVDLNIVN